MQQCQATVALKCEGLASIVNCDRGINSDTWWLMMTIDYDGWWKTNEPWWSMIDDTLIVWLRSYIHIQNGKFTCLSRFFKLIKDWINQVW